MENSKKIIEQEMAEMMERMNQSDAIVCTNIERLHFSHKRENDVPFMQLLSQPLPNKIRNVGSEYEMFTQTFGTRLANCSQDILRRGGNNVVPNLSMCGGYECFQPNFTREYQMIPCKQNSFQNYLIGDEEKVCSSSHQLFNNITKRL
jgi:hypothetical protein